ncbi:50S rRNA methyltransferase [Vibrio sp. qd031]|uniref:methyltransferase n=1 Tax=Vibrio sp. qd031 TaxID=1603038 RepID=UPI000A104818|nr:methyltransferase [Vibrio sp. qd031]ORT49249.1 50S rRNA methyltransferase [Vibrio sp. qd031]
MKTQLQLPDQTLQLQRYPYIEGSDLQAWSAGDEYLYRYLQEQQLDKHQRILILNDHFGALSCLLASNNQVTFMSDSKVAHLALRHNLLLNQLPEVNCLTSIDSINNKYDVVVMCLPKINRMLCWQLTQLRAVLPSDIPVIAVDKAKQIHSSTLKLFEQHLGTTTTSLAYKKHRLIFSFADNVSPKQAEEAVSWSAMPTPVELSNLANVYSGEKLDQGARLLLEHLPTPSCEACDVIDLGCGNGIIGIRYKQLNPTSSVTFVDESFMAVESAKRNAVSNIGTLDGCSFRVDNCLESAPNKSADIILCNPPFHQQNAITDHIAQQMFGDAKSTLRSKGTLRVIGNRHLGYFAALVKLFGREQVSLVTQNRKFVIIDAIKR